MNCKPGELACVVRLPENCSAPELRAALQEQLLGRVVRVIALDPLATDTWTVAKPFTLYLPIPCVAGLFPVVLAGIEDHLLQPIRGVPVSEEKRGEVPA